MIPLDPRALDRLVSKLDRNAPNGCWVFTGSRNLANYGVLTVGGKQLQAHRVAIQWLGGQNPDGKVVCHKCDNPPCCNPDHLFVGTHKDNAADMVAKGRHRTARMAPSPLNTGDLMALCSMYLQGRKWADICDFFGLSRADLRRSVSAAKAGKEGAFDEFELEDYLWILELV